MGVEVYPETSITNYPVTRRNYQAVRVLSTVDLIQDGTEASWGVHDAEGTEEKVLKE